MRAWLCAALLLTAGAARAEDCKPLSGVTAVPLLPGGGGRPVIPVTIAGAQRSMILDTGAFLTSLTLGAVGDLKLQVSTAGKTLNDVLGNESSQAALMPTLEVGRLKAQNIKAMVLPHALIEDNSQIVGVFGSDLLRNYDVDLDFASGRMRLFSPDHCPGKVVFWHPRMLAAIPMHINRNGDVIIKMTLDGEEVHALVDTGSNITALNADAARRLFGLRAEGTGKVNGTIVAQSMHRFGSLAVEGLSIANPEIAITQDMFLDRHGAASQWYIRNHGDTEPYEMLLGMRELSKLHIYIDYRDKTLFVSPAGDEVLPPALTGEPRP